jgi:hypothetical protein
MGCLAIVPSFQIHVTNSDFTCTNEVDAFGLSDARDQALRSVLAIGADEMCRGTTFFGAEVRVEADGEIQDRFLVSMGQSPLK